ncbi:MAG: small subunit ribosomal protein [Solirubrobacterales bacterium]|jgi:small subunit ribosomal protein S9|nr:small subunit ribosomal protein [Solirubrobacterales bacterium]
MADDETRDETTPEETAETPDPAPVAEEQGENTAPADEAAAEQVKEAPAEETPADEQTDETPAEEPVAEAEEPVAEEPVAEQEEAPAPETAEEPAAAEEPASAEQPPAAEEPAAEQPATPEKKKDAIPGADLEPIAVEPQARELSAEERARLEAEKEEKARREAELTATDEPAAEAASRAPAKMESGARYLATGKRKCSIARVTVLPGDGKIEINKRSLEEFFPRPLHQTMARQPLTVSGYEGNVDVRVRVHGGGISGQAGAVRHGIARALTEIDAELRGDLKRRGFLTRDARVKERRKAGFKKARKKPQFSKR